MDIATTTLSDSQSDAEHLNTEADPFKQTARSRSSQSATGRGRLPQDPAIRAIELVRKRYAAFNDALKVQGHLERELPDELCKSEITYWERKIVKTDAPEWISSVRTVHRACEKFQDALWDAINTSPTSASGALALLNLLEEDMGFKHMAMDQQEMSAFAQSLSSFIRSQMTPAMTLVAAE
ncbi:unknown protein [Azorhizobium caulinodans ORS 571]|uniref:Uncharacterized protein n=1 Tax=Azorhizobium caulinodans (strain ATCC 43989 / DSM 5975 / JCM 20966 / LMG 6465 / NBRC 14845 / NCIMB 13405 / ORS 571) TaxID=438753 RepID=A8HTF3_AZOC5|nr:hypothetical protein [Azorhizobium caulinodans]BAF86828.1 unknown protein [Azorhizobium caulinodans ORS 571]